MPRLEIPMKNCDDRNFLVNVFALKGWKTWVEERTPKELKFYWEKELVVCTDAPDDVIKYV